MFLPVTAFFFLQLMIFRSHVFSDSILMRFLLGCGLLRGQFSPSWELLALQGFLAAGASDFSTVVDSGHFDM